jgi:hypothetical protein
MLAPVLRVLAFVLRLFSGLCSDPREDRYFSIPRQTSVYDPDHVFIRLWVDELKTCSSAFITQQLSRGTRRKHDCPDSEPNVAQGQAKDRTASKAQISRTPGSTYRYRDDHKKSTGSTKNEVGASVTVARKDEMASSSTNDETESLPTNTPLTSSSKSTAPSRSPHASRKITFSKNSPRVQKDI